MKKIVFFKGFDERFHLEGNRYEDVWEIPD